MRCILMSGEAVDSLVGGVEEYFLRRALGGGGCAEVGCITRGKRAGRVNEEGADCRRR